MDTLRIATYNIHKCVGMDRKYSPERIVDVLREIDADIVALQEVVCHTNLRRRDHQAEYIASELGMGFCLGENRKHKGADYGNAILSRFPIYLHRNFDISVSSYEPRGCLWAKIADEDGKFVHFLNVHMQFDEADSRFRLARRPMRCRPRPGRRAAIRRQLSPLLYQT